MGKKVTLVVPIYNSESTLRRCLDGVVMQDYPDLEVILVDNNSTDNSMRIINEYMAIDSRLKVCHEVKQGAGAARNRGIDEGTGDILCFVDSDDELISASCISECVEAIQDVDMVWFDFANAAVDRKRGAALFLKQNVCSSVIDVLQQVEENDLHSTLAVLWNKAFRYSVIREAEIRFPEGRSMGEDFPFVLQYLTQVETIRFLDKVFYKKWEAHLTATSANAFNLVPLTIDYIRDIDMFLDNMQYKQAYLNLAKHLSNDAVIAVVRMHHPQNVQSKRDRKSNVRRLLHCNEFQKCFENYHPQKGQSRALPFFMKARCVFMVLRLGEQRAKNCYGRV